MYYLRQHHAPYQTLGHRALGSATFCTTIIDVIATDNFPHFRATGRYVLPMMHRQAQRPVDSAPPHRRCQGAAGHVARLEHAPGSVAQRQAPPSCRSVAGSSHRFDLHRVRHAAVARGGSPSRRRATSGSRAAKSAPLTGARSAAEAMARAAAPPGTGPELRRIRALLRRQRRAALRGGWYALAPHRGACGRAQGRRRVEQVKLHGGGRSWSPPPRGAPGGRKRARAAAGQFAHADHDQDHGQGDQPSHHYQHQREVSHARRSRSPPWRRLAAGRAAVRAASVAARLACRAR